MTVQAMSSFAAFVGFFAARHRADFPYNSRIGCELELNMVGALGNDAPSKLLPRALELIDRMNVEHPNLTMHFGAEPYKGQFEVRTRPHTAVSSMVEELCRILDVADQVAAVFVGGCKLQAIEYHEPEHILDLLIQLSGQDDPFGGRTLDQLTFAELLPIIHPEQAYRDYMAEDLDRARSMLRVASQQFMLEGRDPEHCLRIYNAVAEQAPGLIQDWAHPGRVAAFESICSGWSRPRVFASLREMYEYYIEMRFPTVKKAYMALCLHHQAPAVEVRFPGCTRDPNLMTQRAQLLWDIRDSVD